MVGSFINTATDLQKQVCSVVGALSPHLPSRAGQSDALDAAVRCVAAGTRDVWEQRKINQTEQGFVKCQSVDSLKLYSPAVSSLRRALVDPEMSTTTETLLSALLLCCFDVRPSLHILIISYKNVNSRGLVGI